MELNIENFNPNLAELQKIVASTKEITIGSGIEKVKEARANVVRTRTTIQKIGKDMRDEANQFAKAVIAKEKELIGILLPEEERLKSIETDYEKGLELNARLKTLPARIQALEAIGDGGPIDENHLLTLNDTEFVEYKNVRMQEWLEKQRLQMEVEKERMRREQEIRDAEKHAREQAEEKAKREIQMMEERARIEKEKHERELERVKEEAKAREIEEQRKEMERKAKMEKQKKYQTWLEANAYDASTMILKVDGSTVLMYKLVSTYKG